MKKDYFTLAFGNLKHRGLRSGLTILGIFIGIVAVVALISMGDGLRSAVMGQFSTLSADKLIVQNAGTDMGPPGSTVIKKLDQHDVDLINGINGVDEVIPRFLRIVKIEFNKNLDFAYIVSIPNDAKKADTVYQSGNINIEDGNLLRPEDSGEIILGSDIAKKNSFDKEIEVGDKILIQEKSFVVKGILKSSSSFEVNQIILMNEEDIKKLLSIGDEYDMIVVQIADSKNAESIAEKIKEELRKDRKEKIGEEDFSVQTPLQAISSVDTILNIINLIVAGIAAISLLVGGIGIANTMYASVLERTKEIGAMKAVGAKNKDILYIFVIESGFLGLIGGVLGAVIGIGIAFGISSIANYSFGTEILRIQLSYPLIFGAISFAFLIGLISGLMPALQASKLKPVEALRK